jgi:release factor glutamine methyltransferase
MILQNKLKENGLLIFASDIDDYFQLSKNIILDNTNFKLLDEDFSQPHSGYMTTKYHQKAKEAGREAKFFRAALVQPFINTVPTLD